MIILNVIAAILGVILLLFLTLLAILLFVPFKLNLIMSTKFKFAINLRVSWLFKLIRVYFEKKGDKSRFKIKILFTTLDSKKKRRKDHKSAEPKSYVEEESKAEPKLESTLDSKIKPEPKAKLETKTTHKTEPDSTKVGLMEQLENAKSKFDYVYNHPDKDILIRLTIKLCLELLKAIKPKQFFIKGEIGTGDPALTGQLVGAIYIVRSFTGLNIDIKGDFEKASLSGEIIVESDIYLYKFLVPICKYALSRPVWKLIKKYIFRKDGKK